MIKCNRQINCVWQLKNKRVWFLAYFLVSAEQVTLLHLMLQPLLQLGNFSFLFLQLVVQTLACFCFSMFKRSLKKNPT